MATKNMIACAAAGALIAVLMLAGCGGSQGSSSSAASSGSGSASTSAASASASAASASATSASASAASASTSAASASAASASAAASSAAAPASGITEQQAREIALKHVNLAEGDVTFTKVGRDTEHGRQEWEIEFTAGGKEYDFDIDATTGDILSFDNEFDDDAPAPQGEYISRDAAKDAALSHAGVAEADCTKIEVELDADHSPVHYDVDFKAGGMEYDYEVDATTGDILRSESERDD